MEELLSEFAEALSAEIAHIEKDSRNQSYELQSRPTIAQVRGFGFGLYN